jgi:hypothetical protein
MPEQPEATLFTAGHGFFQFALTPATVRRSLYYNLLLQPALAIPDHYLLHGNWLTTHLAPWKGRDSWVEMGLRHGWVRPYLREEGSQLSEILVKMQAADRRGFSEQADRIAARLDRTPFDAVPWSSSDNSRLFGATLATYLTAEQPPVLEAHVDPDGFLDFWARSRGWIHHELASARARSAELLDGPGLLLSQLIQVSAERITGDNRSSVNSVDDLLQLARSSASPAAAGDLQMLYTCAAEIYNRSLADTILTASNSPAWSGYIAAMDLWRDGTLDQDGAPSHGHPHDVDSDLELVVRLPHPRALERTSGDVLTAIRRSAAADRYFESLANWRAASTSVARRSELVDCLRRYSEEIRTQVGKEVGMLGLRPRFIGQVTDVSSVLQKVPSLVQGVLAVTTTTAASATGHEAAAVPVGVFTLFALQIVTKYVSRTERVTAAITGDNGLRIRPDVTIDRL